MNLFQPTLSDDPTLTDAETPVGERVRAAARSWIDDGFGAPLFVYGFYALKLSLYALGFLFVCGPDGDIGKRLAWTLLPIGFQKAVVWSALFEALGLGCGSGPLTGRYRPPFGGSLYFLRPGTPKRPPWPALPLVGGDRRTALDVLLYVAFLCLGARLLALTSPGRLDFAAWAIAWAGMSLADSTLFLAARSEHYATLALCFALSSQPVASGKAVTLALWWWAGVSKWNRHFPYVVAAMTCNNPLAPRALRRRMVRSYPTDLTPSRLASALAHLGTALELGVPAAFLAARTMGEVTVALGLMLALHAFITANVPLGVPLEWNLMMVYSGFALFRGHPTVSLTALEPGVAALLVALVVVVPLVGNLRPAAVSFLPSMRYYAGNWACSLWLFRGDAHRKLHASLALPAPWVTDQLRGIYPEPVIRAVLAKALAFRAMHLHGRALALLARRAASDLDERTVIDGELVCGATLGWNFGDGHLHDERLVANVQRSAAFAPGELRCVMLESQPLFHATLDYRIVDAATGELERGRLPLEALLDRQPWDTSPLPQVPKRERVSPGSPT